MGQWRFGYDKEERIDLNDIQHNFKLTENQDLMASPKQLSQKPVEHHHLSACIDELFAKDKVMGFGVDGPVEQEGMGTNFAQLHDCVLEFHVIDLADW